MKPIALLLAALLVACSPQPGDTGAASASPRPEAPRSPGPIPGLPTVAALPPPNEAPIRAVIASPVAAAATHPPATPTPTPDPAVWRVEGVAVTDDTFLPIRDVCVAIGPNGCQRFSPHTDDRGVFSFDVPQNPTVLYDLYFAKDGYWTVWIRVKPQGPSVYNLALTKR